MPISKKHHYTPRYYLKRFESDLNKIWRMEGGTNIIVEGNAKNFGYKKHWNTLRKPPVGYEPDWAEQRLSEVDGYASALVERIIAGDLPKDIRPIACAISFMKNNQPRLRQELELKNANDVKNWSDDHWLIARVRASLDDWPNYIPVTYWVQMIDEKNDASRFLTSSNPLIEFDNMPTKLLPLSNRHCLILSFDKQFDGCNPSFQSCSKETVVEINRRTVENSWQYVYSSTANFSV
jgi:Protein of unknown function (DUF4238)